MKLKIGDKVAYSAQWLKSTGQYTGDICFARGVILSFTELSKECILAEVDWSSEDFPKRVNVKNLARVGPNREFCNVD